jgi:membrane-associated phospholipid phosphatase
MPPLIERALWNCAVLGIFAVYFVVAPFIPVEQAYVFDSALDRSIPLWPAWEWLYGAVYAVAFAPVLVIRDLRVLRRAVLGYAFIYLVSNSIFVIAPVRMVRPEALLDPHASFVQWALGLTYVLDRPVNCFPSLHVSNAFFVAFLSYQFDRAMGRLLLVVAVGIGLSTLFTRQHYVIDAVCGAALGYLACRLIARPRGGWPQDVQRPSRISWLWLPALYALCGLIAFAAYWSGYQYQWPGPFAR